MKRRTFIAGAVIAPVPAMAGADPLPRDLMERVMASITPMHGDRCAVRRDDIRLLCRSMGVVWADAWWER